MCNKKQGLTLFSYLVLRVSYKNKAQLLYFIFRCGRKDLNRCFASAVLRMCEMLFICLSKVFNFDCGLEQKPLANHILNYSNI